MRFFVTRSFSIRNPQSGRMISGQKGDTITQSTKDKLSQSIIDSCIIPLRNRPRNGEFTREEFQFLVDHHLMGLDRKDINKMFYLTFPNHTVNDGPLCQLFIIRGLDNDNEYEGFNHPSKTLMDVCLQTNPSRFV